MNSVLSRKKRITRLNSTKKAIGMFAKSANIPLSYEILHEKALQFYAEFKSKNVPMKDKFEATRGWISNFLHRHNLSSKIMREIRRDLPVRYKNNSSAWMTGEIWIEYLKWFDLQLEKDSLLFVDNCSAHVDHSHIKFKYLKVVNLPPNTTAIIQALDAGVIKTFKLNYRKLLVKHWIRLFESNESFKPIDLKTYIDFLDEAWSSVSDLTIKRCWRHADILPAKTKFAREICESTCCNMSSEDYVVVDNLCPTFCVPNVEEIVEGVLDCANLPYDKTKDSDDDSADDDPEREFIPKAVGYEACRKALGYLEQFSSIKPEDLRYVKDLFKRVEVEELQKLKQPTIFDFLRLSQV
ncbi:unnamed protein product [Brachionus calyciflorus]|uniref:HTH CENPB-type domain-containing protein n=1 Tax=Brachionus calyciflorus TaxID=104777 RepID=A0A813PPB1_9BILA|nr:unnamed protein product [Brachionus calyciflorus]